MQNLKFLNNKGIKKILNLIKEQYNADVKIDYAFLMNEKNKVFIVNKQINEIDLEKLRINSVGLYIAETINNSIRLSIEGSQLIGPFAKKNIIELNEEQMKKWLRGEELDIEYIEGNYSGFVILKHQNDFLGSGKFINGKILNYVGKARRINT